MGGQSASDLISLPQGGGAVAAMDETFAPDLHTGTGNLRVPLELPPGRHGLAPTLTLAYSTGQGSGPFGLGWHLAVPQVRRKTAKRIPRFDGSDVFVLSGAEDLVPVPGATQAGTQRFRPRTETLFARVEHLTAGTDHWQVWSKDGLRSVYGTPRPSGAGPGWRDPATVADPADPTRILTWLLTSTVDPCGNVIGYRYVGDPDDPEEPQRYLSQIGYADYTDGTGAPRSLVQVRFSYEPRADRTADRRGGFRVRTTQRCTSIQTWMDPGVPQLVRSVDLSYTTAPGNAVSLLTRVRAVGHDGDAVQPAAPIELGYTAWDPTRRRYQPLRAAADALPDVSLAHPDLDLVDLFGDGLPSVLQLSGTTARCWRNLGGGQLDRPRMLRAVPAGVALGAPGVQIADLDGDGRPDLLVTDGVRAGYFPVDADGGFDPGGYVRYPSAPAFGLADPDTRLVDLDGDGVADAIRTGTVPQTYLNSRTAGWVAQRARPVAGLSFADPRIRLADMTGDGLTDIVLVRNGRVQYWPNLGYGRFGDPVVMAGAPRFDDAGLYGPDGFDERRLLLGDVDGDGCADLVYVAPGSVSVWVNRSGESFAAASVVRGTPHVDDLSAVRLADMLGCGTAGVLWTFDSRRSGESSYKFLDLTGGTKPYLLSTVDNHVGGRTEIRYDTSTKHAAADAAAGRRWRTSLPFPVHVVSRVTVTDAFAGSTQSTSFRYHHGYWDGAEREFRGFGRVDQLDAQSFDPGAGLPPEQYSPPTESRTWFHQGPVGRELGGWTELDLSDEYWTGDTNLLGRGDRSTIPVALPRRGWRDAIRALAGSVLRTELYGRDGAAGADRPYTVTEHCYDLVPVTGSPGEPDAAWLAHPVVAVHQSGARTTQWERGTDPMTRITLCAGFDGYGRVRDTLEIAPPRGRDPRVSAPRGEPPLVTLTTVDHATRDDPTGYLCDRAAGSTRREILSDGSHSLAQLRQAVLVDRVLPARLLAVERTFYDGEPFVGLPAGQLGDHGLPTATATLATTRGILGRSHDPAAVPPYLAGPDTVLASGLRGEYFADDALAKLAFSRPDRRVELQWLGGPDPALAQPTFSVRWTGTLRARFTEAYSFAADRTGGLRVWVADQLVIDSWSGPGLPGSTTVPLVADVPVSLRVEYRATGWNARIRLLWASASQGLEVVPQERLAPLAAPAPLWPPEYPAGFRSTVNAGYTYQPGGDGVYEPGYYVVSGTRYNDRGLPTVQRNPFGNDITIGYDPFDLLPATVTDPAGLVRGATYDYRVGKPAEVVDANGNHTRVGYTPLGLVAWTAALGHPGAHEGDTVEQPGASYSYGLTAWDDSRQPCWVHVVRRVDHRWTIVNSEDARRAAAGQPPLTDAEIATLFPADEAARWPERFTQTRVFHDGTGRDLQTRTQSDTLVVDDLGLPAAAGAPAGDLIAHRQTDPANLPVNVSGWRGYDNKGRVVRAWEPYLATGWTYVPAGAEWQGTTLAATTTYYDPRGEMVYTVHPDGSQDRAVYGAPADLTNPDTFTPTPWQSYRYDRNDNAGRTHPDQSGAWSDHWNTPVSSVVDALGRTASTVTRLPGTELTSRAQFDIQGRLLTTTDALGRTISTTRYDLRGRPWLTSLLDAGTTTSGYDADGNVLEHRDAKGAVTLTTYDVLGRPARVWAAEGTGQPTTLRHVVIYADAPEAGLSRTDAAQANLLGQPYRSFDEAGLVVNRSYDLGGQLLGQTRRVLSTATLLSRLPASGADWSAAGYVTDWQPPPGQSLDTWAAALLDPASYDTDYRYDALGRRTSITCPVDVTGRRRRIEATFARSGALSTVTVDGTAYLTGIAYNARGQRLAAWYGNGVLVRYRYDPATFRLVRQHSQPATATGPTSWRPSGAVLQDQGYTYDLIGNPLTVAERTPGSGVPGPTPDALDRLFRYDALYRLTRATGREHVDALPEVWSAAPRGTDVTATRGYTQTYRYDAVGNLLTLTHQAGGNGFTRTATLATGGNRLSSVTSGGTALDYGYDPCGNQTRETTSRHFGWDAANRLATFRIQADSAASPSLFAQYRYDPTGARVLKLVRHQGGGLELSLYLAGGLEPLLRTDSTGVTSRHDELHVSDSGARLAVLRIGPPLPGDQRPALGYHLSDALGSTVAVLDGSGQLINREEYAPYGETTFGGYARKRYRFTGRERDEESGLAHHGQRYYAPWLARWISCDPMGVGDGPNLYRYAHDRPTARVDTAGLAAKKPDANGATGKGGTKTGKAAKAVGKHEMGPYKKMRGGKIGGTEPTVMEHPIPGAQFKDLTKDPVTGVSDYGKAEYRADMTYANPKADAMAKTHEHGSVPSDNARTAEGKVKQALATEGKGPGVSLNEDMFLPSVTRAVETNAPRAVAEQSALSQVGNLFSRFRLREAGARVAQFVRSASKKGTITVGGAAALAGTTLTVVAAVQTGANLHSAYQESVQTQSYTPLAKASVHEAGSWGGGFVGGFALGVGTGPGAIVTGLVGGVLGAMGGQVAADAAFEEAQRVVGEIQALPDQLDTFVKTMLLPSGPKPWGNW